jgi:drug/metabolite transporter (DMT)-like permease
MTALLIAVFHKEDRLSRFQTIGFGIAFWGMVLVVFNGAVALQLHPLGDFLALLASLIWSVYSLLLRRWSDEYSSILVTRKLMFYGIVTTLPLFLINAKPIDLSFVLTWSNGLKIAYLGIIGSALCYLFWNMAIRRIGVLKTNLYIYSIPLVTLLVSALFLEEKITLMGVIGIVLVIAGMLLGTVRAKTDS